MTDAIKLKVLPKFPSKLIGGAGIDITKANGDYTFDLDYNDFPVVGSIPAGTQYALIFDPATGLYRQVPINLLGNIGDAPSDSQFYARQNAAWVVVRERLTGTRIYYVRSDGSDANNGLANTPAGAFLTIQKAVNAALALDLAGFSVQINVAAGTYSGFTVWTRLLNAGGSFSISGDVTTPSNVVINGTAADAVKFLSGAVVSLQGLKFQSSVGNGLYILENSIVTISDKCEFGAVNAAARHIYVSGAQLNITAPSYLVSGDAISHMLFDKNAVLEFAGGGGARKVTLVGTRTFTGGFVDCQMGATMRHFQVVFDGTAASAIGPRYSVSLNGSIQTFGGGANYFPGNSVGVLATGGQYA